MRKIKRSTSSKISFLFFFILSLNAFAEIPDSTVTAALDKARKSIAGYFDASTKVIYAISAIIGLVGAIKVYSKWNSGDPDTQKVAAAWFGACIFLVVVGTVIKIFFGVDALIAN